MLQETQTTPAERFRLEQIADGVYATIAIPGRGAQGNAGLIDLGDGQRYISDARRHAGVPVGGRAIAQPCADYRRE